ncbi:hypothetical protein N333_12216, partial [Nestor notabilis]
ATEVPVVPVGVRAGVARSIESTIPMQTPITQRTPTAIQTTIAQGAIAPIAIVTSIASQG